MTATDFDALVSFEDDLEAATRDDNDYTGEVVESLAGAGIKSEESSSRAKPWMKYHRFELVKTAARVRELVDRSLEVGRVALDLETQGLDNRINFDAQGNPSTEHKIVGYCLGLERAGYYIPVRHDFEKYDPNPNVDSVIQAEAEITRLCQAAQPVLKPGAEILGAREKDFEVAPKVVIEFWHAKFDQEFLYPVTGIDVWNPHSFEDGMLMAYVIYTDDDLGLKENARDKLPPAGGEHRYEMIEFKELFLPGMKKKERKIAKLSPLEGSDVVFYGCSDGICTNLLCELLLPQVNANTRFKSFYRLEKQVAQSVRIIERQRIKIDKKEIDVLLLEAETELAHYESQIKAAATTLGFGEDFNPSSSAQLAELLFSPKGLDLTPKPEKTAEGQYKTDEKTIDAYVEEHAERMPVLGFIVKHRQINKVRGTYLKNLAENTDDFDQLRLNFKQTGAATGRFTAPKGDPEQGYGGIPIQGIPARDDPKKPKVAHSLRRMFISRPGYVFVKVDYASQELRIATSVSGEEKWLAEYRKELETGKPADLHFLTAQAFFPGLSVDSPDFSLKRNAGKCVHGDTLVLTHGGLKPIRTLGSFGQQPDTFLDAPKGLTVDGSPVLALYNGGTQDLVHVVGVRGAVTCTENHRFRLKDGQLVRAGDLKPGMLLESFIADGVQTIEPHWRNISSVGTFLARHHYYNGAPAKIAALDGGMASIEMCTQDTLNEVIAVIPAGRWPCFDITMGTEEHLYRANCLMTHNTANFALVYGGGVGAVQRATGCDEVEASRLKKAFDDSVPQFSKWVKRQHHLVKANLGVETAFHRFIAIPDAKITPEEINRRRREAGKDELPKFVAAKEAKKIQSACERKATNFPIQGSGADILKISLVLLTREFMLRGWLRNGGDDSVRMVMTVHDEIVFEIREERVAEAVPVIVKIMESPYKLAKWQIPLIAEPDLGYSWAAKVHWHKMLREGSERPPYLQGIEINLEPDVIVLRPDAALKEAPPSKSLPNAPKPVARQTASPSAAAPPKSNGATPEPRSPSKPPPPEQRSAGAPGQFLSIKLNTTYVDPPTVCNIVRACTDAKIEAFKHGKTGSMVPVEFLLGTGALLYSRKEGYKVYTDELVAGLRRMNLIESHELRDVYD